MRKIRIKLAVRRYQRRFDRDNSANRFSHAREWDDKINRINGIPSNQDPRYREYLQRESEPEQHQGTAPEERAERAKEEAKRLSNEFDSLYRASRPRTLDSIYGHRPNTKTT